MKKLIILFVFQLICICSYGQILASGYFDGYWSKWGGYGSELMLRGNYGGFIMYLKSEGPWNYFFKFQANHYHDLDKKTIKDYYKNERWHVYSGTVEYYICDDYPTIYDIFKASKGPIFVPAKMKSGRPTKKVTKSATIKIAPYKKRPKVYNIIFENVGVAIDLNNEYFPE